MNVLEASVTLAEAEELMLLALASKDLDAAKSATLEAINQLQLFRNSWFSRVRTVSSRHPPVRPVAPKARAATLFFPAPVLTDRWKDNQ